MRRILLTASLLALTGPAVASAAPRPAVTADPGGGRSWTATVETAGTRTCSVVRQRGSSRRTRLCGRVAGDGVYVFGRLLERRRGGLRRYRTVFAVAFAPSVTSATLQTPDGARTYRARSGRARVLLAVLAGRVQRDALTVTVRRDGRTVTTTFDPEPGAQDGDLRADPAESGGRPCVQWVRGLGRFSTRPGPAAGPERCGVLDPGEVLAYADEIAGGGVVVGRAGADVRTVLLARRGTEVPLRIDPATRTFVRRLAGPPRGLTLVLVRADGTRVERDL